MEVVETDTAVSPVIPEPFCKVLDRARSRGEYRDNTATRLTVWPVGTDIENPGSVYAVNGPSTA